MATTVLSNHAAMGSTSNNNNPKPQIIRQLVCFSYAAYAKNLIHHLIHSSNIPVEFGLSDDEFSAVESSFGFKFPPDLRSILQEGLPVGSGFPNWRSSSKQQLHLLTNLPILGICKQVSKNGFWIESSWGEKPENIDRAVILAKEFLKKSPILVPIYQHFYIPSNPCMAGNPVFYVHGGDVRVVSFDIAGLFEKFEFGIIGGGEEILLRRPESSSNLLAAPAWAAKEARVIEFWTELAERGGCEAARGGWWSGELGGCLEGVWQRLRDGGWKEEDIKEMMMMDGGDDQVEINVVDDEPPLDREHVKWRVRMLSDRLLRGGWSTEDVVESLGLSS